MAEEMTDADVALVIAELGRSMAEAATAIIGLIYAIGLEQGQGDSYEHRTHEIDPDEEIRKWLV